MERVGYKNLGIGNSYFDVTKYVQIYQITKNIDNYISNFSLRNVEQRNKVKRHIHAFYK